MWKDTEGHDIGGKWVKCWREAAYSPFNKSPPTNKNKRPTMAAASRRRRPIWSPLLFTSHLHILQYYCCQFSIFGLVLGRRGTIDNVMMVDWKRERICCGEWRWRPCSPYRLNSTIMLIYAIGCSCNSSLIISDTFESKQHSTTTNLGWYNCTRRVWLDYEAKDVHVKDNIVWCINKG